jgi:hypothetical protein
MSDQRRSETGTDSTTWRVASCWAYAGRGMLEAENQSTVQIQTRWTALTNPVEDMNLGFLDMEGYLSHTSHARSGTPLSLLTATAASVTAFAIFGRRNSCQGNTDSLRHRRWLRYRGPESLS